MARKNGIGSHQNPNYGASNNWITPKSIIDALGGWESFDLDPCPSDPQPWPTARCMRFPGEGLLHPFAGRVWLNPPYGDEAATWVDRLAGHGNGIALLFARTETAIFFPHVWDRASGILFLRTRITFHYPDGSRAKHNGGAPNVLVAYGQNNCDCLQSCGLAGKYLSLKSTSKGL